MQFAFANAVSSDLTLAPCSKAEAQANPKVKAWETKPSLTCIGLVPVHLQTARPSYTHPRHCRAVQRPQTSPWRCSNAMLVSMARWVVILLPNTMSMESWRSARLYRKLSHSVSSCHRHICQHFNPKHPLRNMPFLCSPAKFLRPNL